jgi:hypothetical protein
MKIKDIFAKFGPRYSPILAIAAHGLVGGSCVASIVTTPLTWMTVVQGALAGWSLGAIIMMIIIERSLKQNELTQRILADYVSSIDKGLQLEVENYAMRQYFKAHNIEFTVTRDGDNFSATAEQKDDAANATDDHAGEDRTLH